MLLKNKEDNGLIKITELEELINPLNPEVKGQVQAGQNEQPPELFSKENLVFPSGEKLPLCWLDSDYKNK